MIAFEVHKNGRRICLVGVGPEGVLTAITSWVGFTDKKNPNRREPMLQVSGLHSPSGEHRDWATEPLKVGDEVRIRVCRAKKVDDPIARRIWERAKEHEEEKAYVRKLAQKFNWKLEEK